MGGMIASEMAAIAPHDVSRLALICPAGLWLDDHPIPDFFSTLPFEMPALLFHDAAAGAQMMTAGRDVSDPNFLQTYLVTNARQLGMAGRILFPIPERGLAGRLYRVKAKTILVWGDSDKLIPPVYAQEFKRKIAGAQLVSIPEAGHMVIFEKSDQVADAIGRLAQ
jgi:pimeloyl-ACP methyl ester carboxylesterase